MRRIICLLLALVFCMYLPMTAFAFTGSAADSGRPAQTPSTTPKTGDTAMMGLWVPVMVLSLLALIVLLVIYFKKFHKK